MVHRNEAPVGCCWYSCLVVFGLDWTALLYNKKYSPCILLLFYIIFWSQYYLYHRLGRRCPVVGKSAVGLDRRDAMARRRR